MLLVVLNDLGKAIVQPIAIEGQVKPVLIGQLGKNPGLVFLSHVQERLKLVRVDWVVNNRQLQSNQGSGGHLDELPLIQDGFVGKAVNVAIGRMADVDHPNVCFSRQAAITISFKDLSYFSWQFS